MRFKLWLPVLQTIGMLLILWWPWAPQAHQLNIALANGAMIHSRVLIAGPAALDWAQGVNLPAAAVVIPVEFATRNPRSWRNTGVLFFGLWLVGLLCWYMSGRFLDDVFQWRRNGMPPRHAGDLIFALIAFPSALLLMGAFDFGDVGAPATSPWAVVWTFITFAALVFRVVQIVRTRRKTAIQAAETAD
jgi:hypothetical protein